MVKMICLSFEALLKSSNDTLIVVWSHSQALILHEILQFLKVKRRIVSFMWLNPSINKHSKMEKRCLCDKNFTALANSETDISRWKSILKIESNNIIYFPDPYDSRFGFNEPRQKSDKYVFSGGFSNRDWETFLEIVKNCPNISFKCIALKKQWNADWNLPENLEVYFDTDIDFYYECMKNASVSVFVCKENKSAGIINVTRSIQYGLIPIITYNDAIKAYYNKEGKEYLIEGNSVDRFCDELNKIVNYDDQEYFEKVIGLQEWLKCNFSGTDNLKQLLEYVCF